MKHRSEQTSQNPAGIKAKTRKAKVKQADKTPSAKKKLDRKTVIIIAAAGGTVLTLLLVFGIYYGIAAKGLKDDASALKASIKACASALKNGNASDADNAIIELDSTSSRMRQELADPKWNLPKIIPPVRQDLETAGMCLDIVDKSSGILLKPATEAVRDSGLPSEENVDLDNLGKETGMLFYVYADLIDNLSPALTEVMTDLDNLPKFHIGMLEDAVAKYRALPELTEQFNTLIRRAPDELLRPAADVMTDKPFDSLHKDDGIDTSVVIAYMDLGSTIRPFVVDINKQINEGTFLEDFPEQVKLAQKLDDISSYLDKLEHYKPLMQALIGDGENKMYLVVAQNSAELRACGGFPGSVGTATIKKGILKFGDFKTVYDVIPQKHGSSIKFSESEVTLFHKDWYVAKARSASANPDFPRCAEIWAAAYGRSHKTKPDGVISLTPHIIQRLMPITGPVTLSNGVTLDENYCIWYLQHDVYFEYFGNPKYKGKANDITDSLFAETANLVEDKLMSNPDMKSALGLLQVLEESSKDRVFMMWMKDEEGQKAIEDLGFSGALNSDPKAPEIGVYYSIKAANKLGPYVVLNTTVGEGKLNGDGTMTYPVAVELSNTMDEETLKFGRNNGYLTSTKYAGDMKSVIYFFAPAGGTIDSFQCDSKVKVKKTTYNDLEVGYASGFFVKPDQTVIFTYTVTTAPGVMAKPQVSTTPTLTEYADSTPTPQEENGE
ncbi:MAG: DUF4012 domain-containing protein [Clostridiales bacterium]|nr:DUF4012 domain-containing protein [Clostridiales bacterium]